MNPKHQIIWLRTVRKYQKLVETRHRRVSNTVRHPNGESLLRRKLDILRRRLLRMNRAWRLGIATASLMAWLNAPIMGQFPAVVDLSDLNGASGFILNGIDSYDQTGISVSSAGDVNGDGIDDLIIGAQSAAPGGRSLAGETYVVFGKSTAFNSRFDLSSLDGSNGFVLNGVDANDLSGFSVSSAKDINGDLIDDLIIGAFPNGGSSEESYVIFGKSTAFSSSLDLSSLNGTNGFIIKGIAAGDRLGRSVSSAGDINGDNIGDIIVGADFAAPDGRSRAGESYVIFGKSTAFSSSLDLSSLDGSNGFTIKGYDSDDQLGGSVSLAGDVNGDGLDDVIVGASVADPNGLSGAGESYVIFGKSTAFSSSLDLSSLDGTNGFVINGAESYSVSGRSVSSAGDVNGDGISDVIIGAYNANSLKGESYVVFGKSTAFSPSFDLSSLDGNNGFSIGGIDSGDRSGRPVSSAGDVNGDDIDDLIIGAAFAAPNGNLNAGESYVVFGKSTGFTSTFDLSTLNGINGFTLNGIDASDISSYSVSSAGDLNGDGLSDLVIGAISADPNGNSNAGESYVIFGCDRIAAMSIGVNPVSIQESAAVNTITYTFTASVPPCFNTSITFSVSGTAIFNDDYYLVRGSNDFNGTTGTVIIPAGQTSVDLVFQVQQDAINENDETIIVTIENP